MTSLQLMQLSKYLYDNITEPYLSDIFYKITETCSLRKTFKITNDLTVTLVRYCADVDYYHIFKFEATDQEPVFIQFYGYYNSYFSCNRDQFSRVKMIEKISYFYEKIDIISPKPKEKMVNNYELELIYNYLKNNKSSSELANILGRVCNPSRYENAYFWGLLGNYLAVKIVAHKGEANEDIEYYDILKFEGYGEKPIYVKLKGSYDSLYGVNYTQDALSIVYPEEKITIIYN